LRILSGFLIGASLLLTACTSTTTRLNNVLYDDAYRGASFRNFLVIAVAENYDYRAQFEREIVAGIKDSGGEATAYYTILGHNPPINAGQIKAAVEQHGFDAVLLTRVEGSAQDVKVKSGPATAEATVRGGNAFDLFRYDYEEYEEPENVRVSTKVRLLTELYAAADEKKIWAVESVTHDRQSVALIIDSESRSIVDSLVSDGFLAR
jgi:hypothetical protein